MTRIAVISDLHSNATALQAALAAAETRGFDTLVILGDLLTYGCDPHAVLTRIGGLLAQGNARLVPGNHDQMYFDLAAGRTSYFDRLPGWLRETAEWTHKQLGGVDLAADLPWEQHFSLAGIFFAHANPFAYGDWTYLNTEVEMDAAIGALRARGERMGVFGHTHRGKVVAYAGDTRAATWRELGGEPALSCHVAPGGEAVADPGSVGQPRGAGHFSSMLFIDVDAAGTRFHLHRVEYDVAAHLARIRASGLSSDTQAKLMSYFK